MKPEVQRTLMDVVSPLSTTAVSIEVFFRKSSLMTGTGFFYLHEGTTYLVTNRHVLTCTDGAGVSLPGIQGYPTRYVCSMASVAGDRRVVATELYSSDGKGTWLEHPDGPQVDVVALNVASSEALAHMRGTLNREHVMQLLASEAGQDARFREVLLGHLRAGPQHHGSFLWMANHVNGDHNRSLRELRVGTDVFIVGFPDGIHVSHLPIWKRGTVGSEPAVKLGRRDAFLVDAITRSGMSGSPVVLLDRLDGKEWWKFVGVYSGRLAASPSEADIPPQMGVVWHERVVREVVEAGRLTTMCSPEGCLGDTSA